MSADTIRPVEEALKMAERMFRVDDVMADIGSDRVAEYYDQSIGGYENVYHRSGAMHMALNSGDEFNAAGLLGQVRRCARALEGEKVTRILELGSGGGFNLIGMAARFPEAEIVGLDLMPGHVERARRRAEERGLSNVTVIARSFAELDEDLGEFDLIYSVEALCYATDLPDLFTKVAARLRPGGQFIVFDSFRGVPPAQLDDTMRKVLLLSEVGMAVNNGFHTVPAWRKALDAAGLRLEANGDYTEQIMPSLRRLYHLAAPFAGGVRKVAVKAMPPLLARNLLTGLLGVHAHAPVPGREDGRRALCYRGIFARKPLEG